MEQLCDTSRSFLSKQKRNILARGNLNLPDINWDSTSIKGNHVLHTKARKNDFEIENLQILFISLKKSNVDIIMRLIFAFVENGVLVLKE